MDNTIECFDVVKLIFFFLCKLKHILSQTHRLIYHFFSCFSPWSIFFIPLRSNQDYLRPVTHFAFLLKILTKFFMHLQNNIFCFQLCSDLRLFRWCSYIKRVDGNFGFILIGFHEQKIYFRTLRWGIAIGFNWETKDIIVWILLGLFNQLFELCWIIFVCHTLMKVNEILLANNLNLFMLKEHLEYGFFLFIYILGSGKNIENIHE